MADNITIKANGLTLYQNISSLNKKIELKENVTKKILEEFKENAFLVAYFVNDVLIGKIQNSEIIFPNQEEFIENNLIMLRVFDENRELFLRRTGNKFKGRLRTDDEGGTPCDFIEADQILLGTSSKVGNNWTFLHENKFFMKGLTIPGEFQLKPTQRFAIKTRNYIGHNTAYQAEYVDARFVKFCPAEQGGE